MIFERTGKRERGRERERETTLPYRPFLCLALSREKKTLFCLLFLPLGLERRASTLTTPSSPSLSTLK